MPKKTYHPTDAHHCGYVHVAVSTVKDGVAVELSQRVRTGEGFSERAAVAQRKLQVKAMKLQEK